MTERTVAALARAGARVTLMGRPAHVEAMQRDGLRIDSVNFQEMVPVQASTSTDAVRGATLVLLTVKTIDTADTVRAMAPYLAPDATVVSMQNGVANAVEIRRYLPNIVVPSVVYVSAEMRGPGWVRHNGRGDLVIGPDRGIGAAATAEIFTRIADLFVPAGVPCRVSTNIEVDLWTKLAMNCAYNAISALGRSRYGHVAEQEGARWVLEQAVLELEAVAAAEGVDLSQADVVAAAHRLAQAIPGALSSTAQDIALGKRTEIDELNGHVVARGAAHGIPTPVNRTLQALVKLLESAPAA